MAAKKPVEKTKGLKKAKKLQGTKTLRQTSLGNVRALSRVV
jgi:hypothetical protein